MSRSARSGGAALTRTLPAGRHGIPAEAVRDNQRQRLLSAIAECCARGGYAASSVSEISSLASVSKKTFYQLFESKEHCLLCAHDDYRRRLLGVLDRACAGTTSWPLRARKSVRAALAMLAADLAGAELLATSVLCVGEPGARRHYELIDAIALRLRDAAPQLSVAYPRAEWCATVSMAAMVGRAANQGDRAAILDLEDDLSAMLISLTSETA